jgi:hypothetical protein
MNNKLVFWKQFLRNYITLKIIKFDDIKSFSWKENNLIVLKYESEKDLNELLDVSFHSFRVYENIFLNQQKINQLLI